MAASSEWCDSTIFSLRIQENIFNDRYPDADNAEKLQNLLAEIHSDTSNVALILFLHDVNTFPLISIE